MLFSSGVEEEQKLSSYSDALYRAFVAIQEGQLTNEDYLASSLDDSVEILRLATEPADAQAVTDGSWP